MAITALPTPPSREDPTNFSERADTFLLALPVFTSEANALQVDVNAKQVATALSASNAATSEANALTHKNNAATSEANAATSEANAATSETNANTSFLNIDKKFLGSKTANPTLDNQGAALTAGCFYWNSSVSELRYYNGSTWNLQNIIAANYADLSTAQTIAGVKTFSSTIVGSIDGNAGTVTNGVYTTGTQSIAGLKTFTNNVSIVSGATEMQLIMGNSGGYMFGGTSTIGANKAGAGSYSFTWSTGALVVSGNITGYSDERLKRDWAALPNSFVYDLSRVTMGTFTRIDSGVRQVGVSAQSLQKILPEAVNASENGTLSVAYGNAALAAAVQLAKEIVALRRELHDLRAEIHDLKGV